MESRVTTANLTKALKAYVAKLPLPQAIAFAARVWNVSFEEAQRRLDAVRPPDGMAEGEGPEHNKP